MRIDFHIHFEPGEEVLARLDAINKKLNLILHKEDAIMSVVTDALDQAEAAAAANSAADDSAEALLVTLTGLITNLSNSQTDPATAARITALSSAISDRTARLAAAVVANTPAAAS